MMDAVERLLDASRKKTRRQALSAINTAIKHTAQLGLDAAVWDLEAARKRIKKAKEPPNG